MAKRSCSVESSGRVTAPHTQCPKFEPLVHETRNIHTCIYFVILCYCLFKTTDSPKLLGSVLFSEWLSWQ